MVYAELQGDGCQTQSAGNLALYRLGRQSFQSRISTVPLGSNVRISRDLKSVLILRIAHVRKLQEVLALGQECQLW